MRFDYATIEWLWNEGWHVAGSVASANWIFWTLERAHP